MEQIEQFSQKMLAKDSNKMRKESSVSSQMAPMVEKELVTNDDVISESGSVADGKKEKKGKNDRNQI